MYTTQVLDDLPPFDKSPCSDGRLVCDNCVSVRSCDFECALWQVYIDISPEMLAKILLLFVRLQVVRKLLKPRQRKQLRLGFRWVLLDYYGLLEDRGYIFLSNTAARMICAAVLSNVRPEVHL